MTDTVICQRCGTENPPGFKFCGACAAPLAEQQIPRQTRKVVTALFCDVVGSTTLGEQLDPEVLRGVMGRYFAAMRMAIERHGGTVEKFIGDAVMAVFGIPAVHEDDALRAVRAAAEIREQLPLLAQEAGVSLQFRTGINTGAVLTGEGENLAIGDAVNVAARLEQAARPGEVVLGPETLQLVRDAVEVEPLEPVTLKGKSEPIAAYRLVRVDPDAPGHVRHLDSSLVGRDRELRLLREAWERAVQESGCHLFTLLGVAGVGKSRLVAELLTGLRDDVTVLRGRCLPYGEGITFWPLAEALMEAGDRATAVLDRLSEGVAATPEEMFWEVRRLLEDLARERPLILYLDDLQWAEQMLLDLLDHIADLSRGVPILLLCTARPELLEERPGWGGGKLNSSTVLLEPLGAEESERLLAQLGDGLEPGARARVIAASQGNPLFLEEIVALARERGTVEVPPTIQALLAARLERLATEERELLERGAVEGEVFHRLAVRALATERLATEVELRLAGLVRKELIRPHPATLEGDEAFRFRHLLIRDAAYDGLPKATRAELHERFARWLEDVAVDLPEADEIAGWHFEQAVQYHQELGSGSDPALAAAGAEHLYRAGRRASDRLDLGAARQLLERALTLAAGDAAVAGRISLTLAETLIETGDQVRADELLSACEHQPELRVEATLSRLEWLHRARPRDAIPATEQTLPILLRELSEAGDERGLAKAHLTAFMSYWLRSNAKPALEHALLAVEHAARSGDRGLWARAHGCLVPPLVYGPYGAAEITTRLDQLEPEGGGPHEYAFILAARAEVHRLEGQFDDARKFVGAAAAAFAALGSSLEGVSWDVLAEVELTAGNPEAALEAQLRGDEVSAQSGEDAFRSTCQARLATIHERLGDHDAASAAIEFCDRLTADEDAINFEITHRVRARMALAEGKLDEAERWARSSCDYAFQTDFPLDRGESKLQLARVLAARGRAPEARIEAEQALSQFELKGDRTALVQTREFLQQLPA